MMRKVIICCPTRNELHMLTRILPVWQTYADFIVIADQMSTDGTREYLAGFDNVHVTDNNSDKLDEAARAELLLQKARSLDSGAVLLYLDADETLSANVLESNEWKRFLADDPGTTGYFLWIQLWRSCRRFIARGNPGTPQYHAFAFIDDGRPLEGTRWIHSHRGPGMARPTRSFYFGDVVNLHFGHVNRMLAAKKQNNYKIIYCLRGARFYHNNRNHSSFESIPEANLDTVPAGWLDAFSQRGLDISSSVCPTLMWYDVEVLRAMAECGERKFWLLDIWQQDWEYIRTLAMAENIPGIPVFTIKGPPACFRFYTDLTLGRHTLMSVLRSLWRYARRVLLP